jgi:hypothetical protein
MSAFGARNSGTRRKNYFGKESSFGKTFERPVFPYLEWTPPNMPNARITAEKQQSSRFDSNENGCQNRFIEAGFPSRRMPLRGLDAP